MDEARVNPRDHESAELTNALSAGDQQTEQCHEDAANEESNAVVKINAKTGEQVSDELLTLNQTQGTNSMDSMDENRDAEKLGETSEEQDQDRKYQNSEDVEAEVVDEEQMPDVNEEEYEEDEDAEYEEDEDAEYEEEYEVEDEEAEYEEEDELEFEDEAEDEDEDEAEDEYEEEDDAEYEEEDDAEYEEEDCEEEYEEEDEEDEEEAEAEIEEEDETEYEEAGYEENEADDEEDEEDEAEGDGSVGDREQQPPESSGNGSEEDSDASTGAVFDSSSQHGSLDQQNEGNPEFAAVAAEVGASLRSDTPPDNNLSAGASEPNSRLHFSRADLPIMHGEPFGMRRADDDGREMLDGMAGRHCVFGFGCTPIHESLIASFAEYLGDGSCFANVAGHHLSALSRQLETLFSRSSSVSADSMALLSSPDLAMEYALQLTRRFRAGKSFRTIAMLGSDHGRTGMTRTASGQPELHQGLGPMMAGFSHVPSGDLDALRASIDDQTSAILLSPVDLASGAKACQAEYLVGVREVCDKQGLLLVMDETQLVYGSTGSRFTFESLADINADIVIASAGLFCGMPGGLVLAAERVTKSPIHDVDRYPLLAASLMSTLSEMEVHGLPGAVNGAAREFAVLLAEKLSGFEFVRDMHVTGMTIGIECDIHAVDIVSAASANGLRIEPAGETAVRLQPPLVMSDEDQQLLLKRLLNTMKAVEQETVDLTL